MKPETDDDKELEMVRRAHDFLFVPPIEGKPNRAEQVDELLGAVRAGKIGTRIVLWLCGLVAAIGVAITTLKAGGK